MHEIQDYVTGEQTTQRPFREPDWQKSPLTGRRNGRKGHHGPIIFYSSCGEELYLPLILI